MKKKIKTRFCILGKITIMIIIIMMIHVEFLKNHNNDNTNNNGNYFQLNFLKLRLEFDSKYKEDWFCNDEFKK